MKGLVMEMKDEVVFVAFTGTAAHQIHGITIHSLLSITKVGKITDKQLNEIRNLFK